NNKIREIESAAFKGNDNASVIVIEFSDFQCPFCKAFFDQTEKQFEQIYVDRGLVKFYYAHLPLEQIHAQAMPAANAAECAKEQGKFWQYHDALFSNQSQLSDTTYEKIASDLGLDVDKWKQCYNEKKYLNVINEHTQIAYSFYASGTPTFVIFNKNGLSQSKKEQLKSINMAYAANTGQPLFQLVTDGDNSAVVISGALPITVFQQIIDIVR
ncbi:MAG: DsbA family protein, partial [Candidatus Anstonellales archaeon]